MSKTQQLIVAVLGVFAVGFFIVGTSERTEEQKTNDSMVSGYAAMSKMANNKCKAAVKKHTGNPVFFPSDTQSDKQSYMTLIWTGDPGDSFKTASCTFTRAKGAITELVIDGKTVISR